MSLSKERQKQIIKLVICVAVGIMIALIPPPEGLTTMSMLYLGTFVAYVAIMASGALPEVVASLLVAGIAIVLKIAPFETIFSMFASSSQWLVVAGFGIALALLKTGLLKRIGFLILRPFPENFRGMIIAFFTVGLVISPLIPSVTSKSALLTPMAVPVSESLGYKKGDQGAAALFSSMFYSSSIFGQAFLTGSLYVIIYLGYLGKEQQAAVTFTSWLSVTWVWLVLVAVLGIIAISLLYKPEHSSQLPKGFMKQKYDELGPMTRDERLTAVVVGITVVLWVTASFTGLNTTAIGLIAMSLLFFAGVLQNSELRTGIPWETMIVMCIIVSYAGLVTTYGINTWLCAVLGPVLSPVINNIFLLIPVICIVVYLMRFVIMSVLVTGAIVFAILSPLTAAAGISNIVILFIVLCAAMSWQLGFNSSCFLAAHGATDGKIADVGHTLKANYAYVVVNIIALMASVPLWKMMDLLQ